MMFEPPRSEARDRRPQSTPGDEQPDVPRERARAGARLGESHQNRRRGHAPDAAAGTRDRRRRIHREGRRGHRAKGEPGGEHCGGHRHRGFRSRAIRQHSCREQRDQPARCQRRRGVAHDFGGEMEGFEVEVVEKRMENEAGAEQEVAGNDCRDRAPAWPTLSRDH